MITELELPLLECTIEPRADALFSGGDLVRVFLSEYLRGIGSRGVLEAFEQRGDYSNAVAITMAMYDVIHDVAPEGTRIAIMSSGGKDSSAAVHYYVESVIARLEAGKRFVPATVFTSNVGHEFTDMAIRQHRELDAIARWGAPLGIKVELLQPPAKDTVLVELIGNGFALPPKASNDKVTAASVSNWCVDRVKRKLLDAATERAAACAPIVIQVMGSRYDESDSRAFRMRKYSEGLPPGITRVALTAKTAKKKSANANRVVLGLHAIGHFTDNHIRDFVHNVITSYRGIEGNLELEKIYRDASGENAEASECSIKRTNDGGFGGGCSNLLTGRRLGCFICLKAQNLALKTLAEKYPIRYARTYRLQQEINEHQVRVHARPKAVIASGFTWENMFPKGFQFTTRYRWLVMILAAEIESGERQLTDEQLSWIERRWRRHGVFTITVEDAKRDAALWLKIGGDEPPVFFRHLSSHSSEFTEALGEGMPLGGFAAYSDDAQADLNLAHLVGMGITGAPLFPELRAYVFDDVNTPLDRFVMVTDTPSVIGTNTNTGLLNGAVGATLRCIGVRTPTPWEIAMADGRHFFYRYSKKEMAVTLNRELLAKHLTECQRFDKWSLADFTRGRNPKTGTPEFDRHAALVNTVRVGFLTTALERQNLSQCGIDYEPLTESYFASGAITDLKGKVTTSDVREGFRVVTGLVALSEALQHSTTVAHQKMIQSLIEEVRGDWALLSQDNDAGKAIRSRLRSRLKSEIFGREGAVEDYLEYISLVKELAQMCTGGKMNTALAVRMAFIVRSMAICEEHGEEYLAELARWLGLSKSTGVSA